MKKINHDTFISYSEFITDSEYIIGIDAGHGGIIEGKYITAPAKMYDHGEFVFYEGVFTRAIAIYYSNMLLKEGISHYFTTDSNYDISLHIRCIRENNMFRTFPNKKHIFNSIHSNAAPEGQEDANGIEVYTSIGDTPADPIASIYFDNYKKKGWEMRKDMYDGDPDKESQFYVLKHTKSPAILHELGFYTNKNQALELIKPDTQQYFAELMFSSTLKAMERGL